MMSPPGRSAADNGAPLVCAGEEGLGWLQACVAGSKRASQISCPCAVASAHRNTSAPSGPANSRRRRAWGRRRPVVEPGLRRCAGGVADQTEHAVAMPPGQHGQAGGVSASKGPESITASLVSR